MFHSTAVRSAAFGAVAVLVCNVAGAETAGESASPSTSALGFVKHVEGSAMLSQGATYVDALSGMKLYDLDRIMVLEDSSAALQLADGCVYEVKASQMLTVQAGDTCETLAARANAQPDMTQVERGATSQLAPASAAAAAAPAGGVALGAGLAGTTTGVVILGGLGSVGIVAALADGTGSDDRPQVSPQQPPLSPQ